LISLYKFAGVCVITPFAALAMIFSRFFILLVDLVNLPLIVGQLLDDPPDEAIDKKNSEDEGGL
jgi:hypothetical protein